MKLNHTESIAALLLMFAGVSAFAQSLDKEYVRMNGRVIVVRRPSQPITVNVTPANQSVNVGLTVQFVATVNNATNPAANWTLNPALGAINSAGLYTASTPVAVNTNITVTATSVQDPTKSHSVTLTVMPAIAVSISPGSQTLQAGSSPYQFVAFVANNAIQSVVWSIDPGGIGTVTASGLYSPPAAGAGSAVLRATSAVDPTKSGTASITVTSSNPTAPYIAVTEQPPPGYTISSATYSILAHGGSVPVSNVYFYLSDGTNTEYCYFNFSPLYPQPYVTGPANDWFVGNRITSYGVQLYDAWQSASSGFTALGQGGYNGFGRAAHTNHCQVQWGYYTVAGNTVTLRFTLQNSNNWPGSSTKTLYGYVQNSVWETNGAWAPLTTVNVPSSPSGSPPGNHVFNPASDWGPYWEARTFTFAFSVGPPGSGFAKSIWWINPDDGPLQSTNGCLIQYNHLTAQVSIGGSFAQTYATFPIGATPSSTSWYGTPSCNLFANNSWIATTPNGAGKYLNLTMSFPTATPTVRSVYSTWEGVNQPGYWSYHGFWGPRN